MRKLNDMFHIDGERLVKTSNGEPVPGGEPLFVLRGRDKVALPVIHHYIRECVESGVPQDRIESLRKLEREFVDFAGRQITKIPGITHGA